MAAVPRSATRLVIYSGVPFSSDYKHTRWFDARSSQTAFFNSRMTVYDDNEFNVIKREGQHSLKVPFFIDDIRNANYLSFNNGGKEYYAFITSMEFENPGTTTVNFVLDVLQSYMFDFSFNPSYVIREHYSDDNTRANTLDEGLNIGKDYQVNHVARFVPNNGLKFMVIVSKTALHGSQLGAIDPEEETAPSAGSGEIMTSIVGVGQPLCYYIIPFFATSENGEDYDIPNVKIKGYVQPNLHPPLSTLKYFYEDEQAVNNIVSIFITETPGLELTATAPFGDELGEVNFTGDNQELEVIAEEDSSPNFIYVKRVTKFATHEQRIVTDINEHFHGTLSEPKLGYSPYAKIVMTDLKGSYVEYNPENFSGSGLWIKVKGSLSPNNKGAYILQNYNGVTGSHLYEDEASMEHALISNDPQSISIVSDQLAAYMQGNRNSLEHQKSSIWMNTAMSATTGLIGGAMAGGGIGAVVGTGLGVGGGLASSVMSIKGMDAKTADISTTPPSVSNMGGNISFDFGNGFQGVYILWKQIYTEHRDRIRDFTKAFGYKTHHLKVPNLRSRRSYNYIQTESCNIKGTFNNEDLTEIKQIFDNGITLWHVDDVGNYDLSNGSR